VRVPTRSRVAGTAPRVPPTADVRGYEAVRGLTDNLSAPLGPEDQVVQSMTDASPTKWHRAHTTWFFEEFVLSELDSYEPHDPDFGFLFNSYYEAVGPRQPRPDRGMITRPDVHEVGDYRRAVDAAMVAALEEGRFDSDLLARVELGLHHEQQHQELLLMDALHMLSQNPLHPAYCDGRPDTPGPGRARSAGLLEHEGGLVVLGHGADGATSAFAYDNEGPAHRQWLEPFALEDRLVTCGEWMEFISEGGYQRAELWLSNGWALVNGNGWKAPLYWHLSDGTWLRFGLHGLHPVEPDEPVTHVSYHEADAFARWRGARLPTEFEWEAVARRHWQPPERGGHPNLSASVAGATGADPNQFTGEGWQWTSSAYLPYPGFSPAAGAIGEYNGKFMVDQHVLRGSSAMTSPGHERVSYRNFFPPAARWAATAVRIAHDR
jgi:ergothioneine biosynthesis protein EgtB